MVLQKSSLLNDRTIQITGSKSESNRLLVLQKLFGKLEILNLSNSQDSSLLKKALESESTEIDIHHAGTAMRFLTSYYSIQNGKTTVLTGSERMKQRPIGFLVSALRDLGAEIDYLENEGFPPLKIKGKNFDKNSVTIPAHISSQFITSLLLIGGKLENGLQVNLEGTITSRPYLEMTLAILEEAGIKTEFNENTITVFPKQETEDLQHKTIEVESDWSSASYYYSLAAIGRKTIHLKSFRKNSLQGDSVLKKLYADFFGIKTIQLENDSKITLQPIENFQFPEQISVNMNDCPDIAQTLCVTATALKIPFNINGLATLKVKETDRLLALKNELLQLGCTTEITDDSIKSLEIKNCLENISIKTYNDHRMAMSFAPFALVHELNIENEDVVEKSYPDFWNDFFSITEAQKLK